MTCLVAVWLLQARVKAINNILDQVAKQTEDCRTQLASIISAERLRECQGFINKVSEVGFTKVKQRQLNKFNTLINKKQGNITRANATIWSNNLVSQTIRQASTSPPGEDNNTLQTNIQAGTNPNPPLAIAHLPPREGSNSLPATAHLPLEGSSSSQAIALLPPVEVCNSLLAAAHLPPEGSSSSQATALLPSGESSNSSQATALPFPSKGSSNPQVTDSPQAGHSNNPTRSVRQGCRNSPRHRATQSSQENSTISWEDIPTTPPSSPPRFFQ